jgi:hypothetical protein
MGFLNGADDKDKASVNILLLGGVVFLGLAIGLILSVLEQTLPLRQMEKQAAALRRGEVDYLPVARFRGAYRGIAENINAGIERVLEKGGGAAARKPADLESILGPVPAQPAMSAFSFPPHDAGPPPGGPLGSRPGAPPPGGGFSGPVSATAAAPVPAPFANAFPGAPPAPGQAPPPAVVASQAPPGRPRPPAAGPISLTAPAPPGVNPGPSSSPFGSPRASSPAFPPAGPPIPPPAGATTGKPGNFQIALDDSPESIDGDGPTLASATSPTGVPIPPPRPGVPAHADDGATMVAAGMARPKPPTPGPEGGIKLGMGGGAGPGRPPAVGTHTMMGIGLEAQAATGKGLDQSNDEEESTVIARAPSELIAAASGPAKPVNDETAEWMSVYDEFLRVKKQCDEPTDGLSFEKFQNTLRKNRDALVQRHQCKRVRFSVYVKDGRASLKATPVKD